MIRWVGLISLVLVLPACRIGNYVQNPPGPEAADGNYEALISSTITMCATRPVVQANGSTQEQTNCPTVPSFHLDALIAYIMSNPVKLRYDSGTGFYFLGPNSEVEPGTPFLEMPAIPDSSNDLSFPLSAGAIASFKVMPESHPGCILSLSEGLNGKYTFGGNFNSGSDLPIVGRITMDLDWLYSISGADCSFVSACYSDNTQCTADDQLLVKQFYGPFVDTGIMGVSELSKAQVLEYQVSYH